MCPYCGSTRHPLRRCPILRRQRMEGREGQGGGNPGSFTYGPMSSGLPLTLASVIGALLIVGCVVWTTVLLFS